MRHAKGFTLVEVMIALVILMIVLLGFAVSSGRMLHTVTTSDLQETAIQLARSRLEMVQLQPNYAALDSMYVQTETNFPTLPGFTRATTITRFGGAGQPIDYKRITVTVSGPGLLAPVVRTTTVAAP
jgi:prepilin-type N-terminal cleavage/methylation domain-containing protein